MGRRKIRNKARKLEKEIQQLGQVQRKTNLRYIRMESEMLNVNSQKPPSVRLPCITASVCRPGIINLLGAIQADAF